MLVISPSNGAHCYRSLLRFVVPTGDFFQTEIVHIGIRVERENSRSCQDSTLYMAVGENHYSHTLFRTPLAPMNDHSTVDTFCHSINISTSGLPPLTSRRNPGWGLRIETQSHAACSPPPALMWIYGELTFESSSCAATCITPGTPRWVRTIWLPYMSKNLEGLSPTPRTGMPRYWPMVIPIKNFKKNKEICRKFSHLGKENVSERGDWE